MAMNDDIRRAIEGAAGLPPDVAQALVPIGGAGARRQPALPIEFHPQTGFGVNGVAGLPPGVRIDGVAPEDVTTMFFETTDTDGRDVKHIFWLDPRGRAALLEMTAQRLDVGALDEFIADLTKYREELAAAAEAESNGGDRGSKIVTPG